MSPSSYGVERMNEWTNDDDIVYFADDKCDVH